MLRVMDFILSIYYICVFYGPTAIIVQIRHRYIRAYKKDEHKNINFIGYENRIHIYIMHHILHNLYLVNRNADFCSQRCDLILLKDIKLIKYIVPRQTRFSKNSFNIYYQIRIETTNF